METKLNCALGFGIKSVISAEHIANIAAKCPSLKKLALFKVRMETWPQLNIPWALEELTIFDNSSMNMDVFICQASWNNYLHTSLVIRRGFAFKHVPKCNKK